MKRALLIFAVALLLPGVLSAQDALLGVYFDVPPDAAPEVMHHYTTAGTTFTGYLYISNAEYYITAIEYQLLTPLDPDHVAILLFETVLPDLAQLQIGDPWNGHSITYWPPLNGYMPGYNLMATYTFYTDYPCYTGCLTDFPMIVGPNPGSGELRGTYSPNNDYFYPVGLTSIICPLEVSSEEKSWGAIKSLYR
jgi:hypothetical protein